MVESDHKDERARVVAGMELLGWTYAPSDGWRFDTMVVPKPGGSASTLGVVGALIGLTLGVIGLGWALTVELLPGVLFAVVFVCGVLGYALRAGADGGGRLADLFGPRVEILRLKKRERPDRVLFTSTGVVFGERARVWKGGGQKLASVEVFRKVVILTFQKRLGLGERLVFPIPEGLTKDVHEMAELLNRSIVGGGELAKPPPL